MTISLGGAPGPRTGGLTPMGGRTVQAPPPGAGEAGAETPPAPKTPEMALPTKNARTVKPQPTRGAQGGRRRARRQPATNRSEGTDARGHAAREARASA